MNVVLSMLKRREQKKDQSCGQAVQRIEIDPFGRHPDSPDTLTDGMRPKVRNGDPFSHASGAHLLSLD
jgi:hypothetical protein